MGAVYEGTSAKLFGVGLRVSNDRLDAEDALQEIYVNVLYASDRYAQNGLGPIARLATIARNAAIDRRRARIRRHEDAGEAGGGSFRRGLEPPSARNRSCGCPDGPKLPPGANGGRFDVLAGRGRPVPS